MISHREGAEQSSTCAAEKSVRHPACRMTEKVVELNTMPGTAVHDSSEAGNGEKTSERKSKAEIEAEVDLDPEKHKEDFLKRTGITTDTATFRLFFIFGTLAFAAILTIFTFDEFLLFYHTNVS